MPVEKVIEVVGTSHDGADAAVRDAVTAASRSIRGISHVDVESIECTVENGAVVAWQATVKLRFPVEPK
jgi:dodecin